MSRRIIRCFCCLFWYRFFLVLFFFFIFKFVDIRFLSNSLSRKSEWIDGLSTFIVFFFFCSRFLSLLLFIRKSSIHRMKRNLFTNSFFQRWSIEMHNCLALQMRDDSAIFAFLLNYTISSEIGSAVLHYSIAPALWI